MPQFSKSSKEKLSSCHADLIVLFNTVILYYDCTVADGYRTKAMQNKYFDDGLSQVKYPTVHNTKPSFAVDVVPYILGDISYDEKQDLHFAGFVEAVAIMMYETGVITHKLRCGSNWKGDHIFVGDIYKKRFKDPCHFEIVPNPGDILKYFAT